MAGRKRGGIASLLLACGLALAGAVIFALNFNWLGVAIWTMLFVPLAVIVARRGLRFPEGDDSQGWWTFD